MREIELRKEIQELGLKCELWSGCVEIQIEVMGNYDRMLTYTVAKVARFEPYEMDIMGYRFLMDLDPKQKKKLFEVLAKFAQTPVEVR